MNLKQRFKLLGGRLTPYLGYFLQSLAVLTGVASLLFLLTIVYRYGFVISSSEEKVIGYVENIIWMLFLFDTTLHLLLGHKNRAQRYRKLAVVLSVLLYLTLVPTLFVRPENAPVLAYVWDFLDNVYFRNLLLSLFSFFYLSNLIVRLLGKRTNPSLMLAVSFFVIIIIGSGLLTLPRCTYNGIEWIDALFVSTSAVCVTGLSSVDVSSTFTPLGLGVMICLIQIGGLGVMTLTSFFAMFFMGNTSFYNQLVVRDMVSSQTLGSLLSTLLNILTFTLIIEGVGALAVFSNIHGTLDMTLREELGFSVFHSVSAFCNAGFSTLSGNLGNPMLMSGHNPFFIYISLLIIMGGVGFPILVNIKQIAYYELRRLWHFAHTRKWTEGFLYHKLNLNTRIVFVATFLLLFFGTLIFLVFEWSYSFRGMPVADKMTHAFFNASSTRTAGFSSVDLTRFSLQSVLFYIFLMWIGGGAQSTAGGIKVNAFAVVVMNLKAIVRGTKKVEVMGRTLSEDSIRRANATAIMSLGVLFLFVFILTLTERDIPLLSLVFECFSAIGTVGSSLNVSTHLSDSGKVLISLLMFLGRVGIITLLLGIIKPKHNTKYNYPSEEIIIN